MPRPSPRSPRRCLDAVLILLPMCLAAADARRAGAEFALPADVTVVESNVDRIVLKARFNLEQGVKNTPGRECFVALPAREYVQSVTGIVCGVYDKAGRLLEDNYVPGKEEADEASRSNLVRLSRGLCHDRVVARVDFLPYLRPTASGPPRGSRVLYLRELTLWLEFRGEVEPGYEVMPERTPADPLGFESLFRSLVCNYKSSGAFRVREKNPVQTGTDFYAVLAESTAAGGAWKFPVTGQGIHRLDAGVLREAGMDVAAISDETLRLWRDGEEVPYLAVRGTDGETEPAESAIYFYDDGEGTHYSAHRVYWLTAVPGDVRHAAEIVPACVSKATREEAFQETQSLGSPSIMPLRQSRLPGIWFRDVLLGNRAHVYPFELPSVTGERVYFHVGFRNALSEELVVVARVNGASATSTRVRPFGGGRQSEILDFSVDRVSVRESDNELSLQILNEHRRPNPLVYEGLYVEDMDVSFQRMPEAREGRLRLGLTEEASGCILVRPTGFDEAKVLVFEVEPEFRVLGSVPRRPSEGIVLPSGGKRVYELVAPSAALRVEAVTRVEGPVLRTEGNRQNYVVIGPAEFEELLAPLLEYRRGQGYAPRFIDIQTVYDEFAFGVPDPHAIRDFVRYAVGKWGPPAPSSVLLVGDAFWDYRNRTNSPHPNLVPTYIPPEKPDDTASDVWFAQAVSIQGPSGDLPDVFLARIPAQTTEEVKVAAEKFIAYETESEFGPWRARILLANDHQFEEYAKGVVADTAPEWVQPDYFDYGEYPLEDHYRIQILRPERKSHTKTGPQATAELVRKINAGVLLWDYFGHGGAFVLSNSDLFIGNDRYDTDVLRLHNRSQLPVFSSLSCLTGLFYINRPWAYSLGESLLLNANGAIATFTPAGYGSGEGEQQLSKRIKRAVFGMGDVRLGEAFTHARVAGLLSGGLDSLIAQFMLFGDPATRLAVPGEALDVRLAGQEQGPDGRRVRLSVATKEIEWGTAAITVYDRERRRVLWDSGPLEFSSSARGMEVSVPGLEREEEGVLQVYAWNPTLRVDGAGATIIPSLEPDVSIVRDVSLFDVEPDGLSGRLAVRNGTSRDEGDVALSVFVDDRLVLREPVAAVGPRQTGFHPFRLVCDATGIHQALFVLRSDAGELARLQTTFAVPDASSAPIPRILPETFRLTVSSPSLAGSLKEDDPLPPGAKARIRMRIVNPSTEKSTPCELGLKGEANAEASVAVPGLAPGEGHLAEVDWVVPPPGETVVVASLRSGTGESAETIQVAEKALAVGEYPDLIFVEGGFRAEPEHPVEGESIRFHLRFRNEGGSPAAGFGVRIYEKQSEGGERIIQNLASDVPGIRWPTFQGVLQAGETGSLSILWHPSENAGDRLFVAALDDPDQVRESSETNNRAEVGIEISPGFLRLRAEREEAWGRSDFAAAEEINGRIAELLDRQLDRFGGDRTWLDYDWFAQRGFSALVAGDLERAAEVLDWGMELLPTYRGNYLLRACVELRRGNVSGSKELVRQAFGEEKFDHYWIPWLRTESSLYQSAEEAFESGDPAKARRLLEKCVELTPVNFDAWFFLYRVRREMGDPSGALAALQGYVDARSPLEEHGIAWYEAMYETLTYGLGDLAAARRIIEKAISEYPDDARFRFVVPYLDYAAGLQADEVREDVRHVLSEYGSQRGVIAATYLLLTRLDLDLNDGENLERDYGLFVFHSSKTAPTSGFRPWPRVVASKREINPELRVFIEAEEGHEARDMMPVLLEKSAEAEPAQLPSPATTELPFTMTLDLGSPRTVDACLIAGDGVERDPVGVSVSVSAESGGERETVAEGVSTSEKRYLLLEFGPRRSRYWHLSFSSASGASTLLLRDLSLMEVRASGSEGGNP